MKFDFAIGNPPYQDETLGDNKGFAPPVYNKFLDAAYQIADKVEMIHPARFLFNGGSTPKAWNEKMLNDEHLKVLNYEEDCTKVFSNTDIKGGIAITYHDTAAAFGAIKIFTKSPVLNSIVSKVSKKLNGSLSDIIYTQNRFNLDALYKDHPETEASIGSEGKDRRFRNNIFEKIPVFTEEAIHKSDIPVIGVIKNKRVWRFINKKYVDDTHQSLNKWKCILARANGSGKFGDTMSTILVFKPGEAYTQTYIGIGAFDTKEGAENVSKYIKTKFMRTMLGVLKVTQDNDREVWRMVPLQDFTASSDINWSKSIKEIDQQLYKKYNLSQEEIDFIETNVKEMA